MWAATAWVIATWLRVTLILAAVLAVCWLALGTHSGSFWLACVAALLAEGYLSRRLIREWCDEARFTCWWWNR